MTKTKDSKIKQARNEFVKQANKRADTRQAVDKFLAGMAAVTKSATFSIDDLIKSCDLPKETVVKLLAKWLAIHEKHGLVSPVVSNDAAQRYASNITVTHVPTNSDAIKQFFGSVTKRDDGSNAKGNLVKFVEMMKKITSRSGTFSVQDAITENRYPQNEIPYEELMDYWNGYINEMLRLSKIVETFGAYEYPVYTSV